MNFMVVFTGIALLLFLLMFSLRKEAIMDFTVIFIGVAFLSFLLLFPLNLFFRKQSSPINLLATEKEEAPIKKYSMQVIVWKNNVPKIDRVPVKVQSEEDGRAMIITVAKKKANELKLEVSTALYLRGDCISSYRALPALTAQ